jgi:hypothetical protein
MAESSDNANAKLLKRLGLLSHRSGRDGKHSPAIFETDKLKAKGFPKPPSYRKASHLIPVERNYNEQINTITIDAKQAYLDRQAAQMLVIYQNADTNERNAIIRQIDSFLSVVPKEAKIFWLKIRHKLERLNEKRCEDGKD